MIELVTIGIESVLISIGFYLGFLIIRNQTTPRFKRFYLLVWLISSTAFPLIEIEFKSSHKVSISQLVEEQAHKPIPIPERVNDFDLPVLESQNESAMEEVAGAPIESNSKSEFDWLSTILLGYGLVMVFLLARILLGVGQIIKMRLKSMPKNGIYQVDDSTFKGASFFKWIFIGTTVDDTTVIIEHEQTHRRLWHSADILLSHLYCAILWINPLSWILKKQIVLNTELEVDVYMIRSQDRSSYANLLLSMSTYRGQAIMNHFGAFHLKSRIKALASRSTHRRWVSMFSFAMVSILFFLISCESINSSEVMVERMGDVKTITTRFISHQSDTKQKTGKIVAIASFGPDGTLEELVEQTTYPYDREFEVKKMFWDTPEKTGIAFVMDGLTLGDAERTFLYGNDWPKAYYKHLQAKAESRDMFWREIVETDNPDFPTEIKVRHEYEEPGVYIFGSPDVTEYFEYEGQKVMQVLRKNVFKEYDMESEEVKKVMNTANKETAEFLKKRRESTMKQSGKVFPATSYEYEGDLMTSIKGKNYERKFYYENGLMVKSEYYRKDELLNTRIHYYKNSLKDRTEIFNRYNEPEYTITYEYAFW